jgi:hypothetical protein
MEIIIYFQDDFFVYPSLNNPFMKNRNLIHAHEEAKIYQQHYRPTLNVFRLLKSVISVVVSGNSPAAHNNYTRTSR